MLLGQSIHKTDSKNRLSIPARIRNTSDFTKQHYIRYHEMGFLEVGQLEDFEDLNDTFMAYAAPFYDIFKTPDASGRVVIPEHLMSMIRDTGDDSLMIFGRGKTFGICSPRQWPSIQEQFKQKIQKLSRQPE